MITTVQNKLITLEGRDRTHMFFFARDLAPRCNNSLCEEVSPHLKPAVALSQAKVVRGRACVSTM